MSEPMTCKLCGEPIDRVDRVGWYRADGYCGVCMAKIGAENRPLIDALATRLTEAERHRDEYRQAAEVADHMIDAQRQQIGDLIRSRQVAESRLAEAVARADTLMKTLCDLTIGGSEFANNPQNCARWIREQLASGLHIATQLAGQRNQEHERANAAESRAGALAAVLTDLIESEPGPCRLDHHGYCQEHFLSQPCVVAVAISALAAARGTDNGTRPSGRVRIETQNSMEGDR